MPLRSIKIAITVVILTLSGSGCQDFSSSATDLDPVPADESGSLPSGGFSDFLHAPFRPADGFDFPFGDADGKGSYKDKATGKIHEGWYVATHFAEEYSMGLHTGEDWNGSGGGDTDLGQDVLAVAHGRVVFAKDCGRLWGNVIILEHLFYENNEKKKIRSVYAHLHEIKVQQGQEVSRRQPIGTIGQDPEKLFRAHLHLELRWDESLSPTYWPSSDGKDQAWIKQHYAEPSSFIKAHRKLAVPQEEKTLLLIDQESYKMKVYSRGELQEEYDVSFGQEKGRKRIQGDNKTPKGMYFVIGKNKGEFPGKYGAYFGGYWIKINYPNSFDAEWGQSEGLISSDEKKKIHEKWSRRLPTLEGTKLGGGIGLHGWIQEWDDAGPRHLSWGCIVMHLRDIPKIYDRISEGAMVVIF